VRGRRATLQLRQAAARLLAPRLFGPWNEYVGRHPEARAQPLHHCQAQFFLASKHLADAARRSEQRDHFCPSELVLIHEMPDQFRCARAEPRPLALLVSSNQTRLRLEPNDIGGIFRIPQPINEGARAQVPRRYRSRLGSHPSHGFRINPVIFCMGAEESDRENSGTVLDRGHQSVVVALDVENNSAGFKNACFWI